MDMETFEEVVVESKIVQDKVTWVEEGMECNLIYFKEKVIEVLLPPHVVVQIVETEPSFKGILPMHIPNQPFSPVEPPLPFLHTWNRAK
eukprot:scaffold70785_cov55-Attheya_sp.AAC.1